MPTDLRRNKSMNLSTSRTVLHATSHGDVPVRRSGEEGGTHRTHGTHGTVADGTKGHKRQRDSHVVLHMLRVSVPSACLGKNLRSKVFHFPALARSGAYPRPSCTTEQEIAYLRNLVAPSPSSCGAATPTGSPARSALFECFVCFPARCARAHILLISKIYAGSP